MGTFAYDIQVFAGGDAAGVRARLVEWLRRRVIAQGYTGVSPDNRDAIDRLVVVGPADRGPWVSVYDDQGQLDDIARDISKELGAPAVIVMVNDSDVLELSLYRDGAKIDHYNSYPDYNGEKLSKAQLAALKGKPDLWIPFLLPGAEPRQLREAWDEKPLFAEDTLAETARLTGIDLEMALHTPEAQRFEGTSQLAFQLAKRPAPRARFDGPPRIEARFELEKASGEVGGALDMGLTARSMGGPSTGLDVSIWGDALEQGLIRPGSALIRGLLSGEVVEAPLAAEQARVYDREMTVYTAHFADFEIPQGIEGPLTVGMDRRGRRETGETYATMFAVMIRCTGLQAGGASMTARLTPHANPDGPATARTPVEVAAPARKPLHYDTTMPLLQYARLMERPTRLVGLVALGMDQAACADAAAAAIEAWHAAILPLARSKIELTTITGLAARPRQSSADAAGFPASKAWASIRKELATCAIISGSAPSGVIDPNGPPIDDGSGFAFGRGLQPIVPRGDSPSPHLALWADLRLPDVDAEKLAGALRALIDEAIVRAAGHQAFIARWDWRPRLSLDSTPYEITTGIRGQCMMLTSWCSRFLRGVSNEVWLGPALLARLGDRSALEAAATPRPVGEALHLALRPGMGLDALEAALAPLLPSTADWQRAVQQMYANVNPAEVMKLFKR